MYLVPNAERDEFGAFTHELRNPLTSIQGCAQTLLQRDNLPDEVRRALVSVIVRQVEQLEIVLKNAERHGFSMTRSAG